MGVKHVIRTQGCGLGSEKADNLGSPGTWRRELLKKTGSCALPTPRGPQRKKKKNQRSQEGYRIAKEPGEDRREETDQKGGDEGDGHPSTGRHSPGSFQHRAGPATSRNDSRRNSRQRAAPGRPTAATAMALGEDGAWRPETRCGSAPAAAQRHRELTTESKATDCSATPRDSTATCATLTSLPLRHVGARDWRRPAPPPGLRLFEGGTGQGAVAWVESRFRLHRECRVWLATMFWKVPSVKLPQFKG